MISSLNGLLNRLGYKITRVGNSTAEMVVHIPSRGEHRGSVLLSYIIDPFLTRHTADISVDHTHDWESWQMAQTYVEHGFSVDVVHFQNTKFVPKKHYSFFFGARTNFERIGKRLNADCAKIAHLDTCHWLYNNQAAYNRLLDLQARRGFTLGNPKTVEENWAIEYADLGCVLGNDFTADTYAYAGKAIHRIPISTPLTYPWCADKDWEACRRKFLWFGSSGFVHKGLDVVLDAFAGLPDFELIVCGPFDHERRFVEAYKDELYGYPNIDAAGWVNVAGDRFRQIANSCGALVYPTCAEGGGGSVITCMHMGVVPIVTPASSVDIGDFGCSIDPVSVQTVRAAVQEFSERPPAKIEHDARRAWEYAREQHTRERFSQCYHEFFADLTSQSTAGG